MNEMLGSTNTHSEETLRKLLLESVCLRMVLNGVKRALVV